MRIWRVAMAAVALGVLAPVTAYAQASLAGVVRDTSGAVLPGVTVEAASPVLIERSRTAITDASGQYRIIDLRPGSYTVTFTLAGFTAVKRDGVALSGESTTNVNADLRISGVEETITVTGAAPTVDVQTTTRQQVISREEINQLPTGRNYSSLGQLLTGVNTNSLDNGGAFGDLMAQLTVHGSRPDDQRVMQNGVNTMTLQAGGQIGIAVPNPGMAAEVTIDTSGANAELTTGGLRINYIPRDGGNRLTGTSFVSFANDDLQADNLNSDLQAKGVTSVDRIRTSYDLNPGIGGPVRQNRVWFYFTGRYNRAYTYPANAYYNKNAYDVTKWTYEADLNRPATNFSDWTDAQLRLTAQVNAKNKVAFTWDQQARCSCPGGGIGSPGAVSATSSPEATANFRSPMQRLLHAEWSSPITSRVLLEGVALHRSERWGLMPHSTAYTNSEVINASQVQLLRSGALIPILDLGTGRAYHGRFPLYTNNLVPNYYFRGAATYVAKDHQLKFGFSDTPGYLDENTYNDSPIIYIVPPGAPITVIQQSIWGYGQPEHVRTDQRADLGIFAQDKWSLNKLALNLGVRFDYYNSGSPAQHVVGTMPLTPNRADIEFSKTDISGWKDLTPRFGAVYDLGGDGRTAIKVSLNKYLQGQTAGTQTGANPVNLMVDTTTRTWFSGGNFARYANCDFTNLNANGECGPVDNPLFGQNNPNATKYSDALQFGWGKRAYNWEFSAGVQREVLPRVSVDVGYYRRWYGNWRLTDNTALSAADYTKFTATGSGTASALQSKTATAYDGNSKTQTNLVARTQDYGEQFERWNGVDVSVNARMQNGLLLFGGVSSGRTHVDNCDVVAKVPESLTRSMNQQTIAFSPDNCDFTQSFQTQVKGNSSYTVPKADVLISLTFQSTPGPVVRGDATITQRAAGQALQGANSSVYVPLIPIYYTFGGGMNGVGDIIGKEYGDRLNQIDLRLGKLFRFGGTRTMINLDLYNLFNSSAATRENNSASTLTYRQPTSVQLARYLKIGAQFDF